MPGAWESELIVVGTPMNGPVESIWFDSLTQVKFANPFNPQISFNVIKSNIKRAPLDKARNMIIDNALKAGATKLFWVDSDVVLPDPFTFMKLYKDMVEWGYKIVSGLYFSRKGNAGVWKLIKNEKNETGIEFIETYEKNEKGQFVFNEAGMPTPKKTKPFEADLVGSGLMLVDMEVYENIDYPYYIYETDFIKEPNKFGEDFYFLAKAKEKGYKLLVDPNVVGYHTFPAMFSPIGQMIGVPP